MISIRGRELCACVRADGLTLVARRGCAACSGTGGVGEKYPTREEEKELTRGGWRFKSGGWIHPVWGEGRWRTALHLARDDARRIAGGR